MKRACAVFVLGCSSAAVPAQPDAKPDAKVVDASPDAPAPAAPLEITALGVQGFVLRHGDDVVLTAPLFTRQSALEVALNVPLDPDTAAIDAGLAGVPLANLRAVISGHAHYDHLIDVPRVLDRAPGATLYTNLT